MSVDINLTCGACVFWKPVSQYDYEYSVPEGYRACTFMHEEGAVDEALAIAKPASCGDDVSKCILVTGPRFACPHQVRKAEKR